MMKRSELIEEVVALKAHVNEWADRIIAELSDATALTPPEDFTVEPMPERLPIRPEAPRNPQAATLADLVTPKQLGMIRHLASVAGVDRDAECQRVFQCRTEELSKRAASSFIDHLKSLVEEEARSA